MKGVGTMRRILLKTCAVLLVCGLVSGGLFAASALADSQSGSVSVTATVNGPPPTTAAVIDYPVSGTVLSVTPLVVNGTCGDQLLVKVFDNGQLAGATTCSASGTFSMNITLVVGENKLQAFNYDTLNQAGPTSSVVDVTVTALPTPPSTAAPSKSQPAGSGHAASSSPGSSVAPTVPVPKSSTHNPLLTPRFSVSGVQISLLALVVCVGALLILLILIRLLIRRSRRKNHQDNQTLPPAAT